MSMPLSLSLSMWSASCSCCLLLLAASFLVQAAADVHHDTEDYTYWCVGACDRDARVRPRPGIVLMGGGTDVDKAFQQHLRWADGGDFLVLRASGTDAYNSYIRGLGQSNSVATLLTKNRAAAEDPFVISKIDAADGIFFAGGDQSAYLQEWQNTTMQRHIRSAIEERQVPVGGTSAGCDIQGGAIYTAEDGSVVSSDALQDPFVSGMTLQGFGFLPNRLLADIIIDTHFITRDRMGRLLAFAARLWQDGRRVAAIGIDEQTALLIDAAGKAKVVRQGSDGGRAFVLTPSALPDQCKPEEPLKWRVAVQKLDALYGDTYDISRMKGGARSQRYHLAASEGELTPGDPYSPPETESDLVV